MNVSSVDLKKTVNLPKTNFPMKANLPATEPKTLATWEQMGAKLSLSRFPELWPSPRKAFR